MSAAASTGVNGTGVFGGTPGFVQIIPVTANSTTAAVANTAAIQAALTAAANGTGPGHIFVPGRPGDVIYVTGNAALQPVGAISSILAIGSNTWLEYAPGVTIEQYTNGAGGTGNLMIQNFNTTYNATFAGITASGQLSQTGNGVSLTALGSGYSNASGVSLTGGSGSGAVATITTAGGQVASITITSPGSGYIIGDVLTISGGGANATCAVEALNLTATITVPAGHPFQAGDYVQVLNTGNGGSPPNYNGGSLLHWWDYTQDSIAATNLSSLSGNSATGISTATTTAAHGLQVGDKVIISGATPSTFNVYRTIISVPSATTFTFACNANGAATGTPAYISVRWGPMKVIAAPSPTTFTVTSSYVGNINSGLTVSGDRNIHISGGGWDFGFPNVGLGAGSIQSSRIGQFQNLSVSLIESTTVAGTTQFGFAGVNCTHSRFINVRGNPVRNGIYNGNVIQWETPHGDCYLDSCGGTSNENCLAFVIHNWFGGPSGPFVLTAMPNQTGGSFIEGITIKNASSAENAEIINFVYGDNMTIGPVIIDGVVGSTKRTGSAIIAFTGGELTSTIGDGPTNFTTIDVKNLSLVDAQGMNTLAGVSFGSYMNAQSVRIGSFSSNNLNIPIYLAYIGTIGYLEVAANITLSEALYGRSQCLIALGANPTVNILKISGSVTATGASVQLIVPYTGTYTINKLVLDGLIASASPVNTTLLLTQFTNTGTLGELVVDNCLITGFLGLYNSNGSTPSKITMRFNGSRLQNVTYAALFGSGPADIYLSNTDITLNASNGLYPFAIFGGTQTVNFYGSAQVTNANQGNSKIWFAGSGTPAVNVYGQNLVADAGLNATTKGQFFTHFSSVAGRNAANQQGPCIAVDGTHFYALGTGTGGVNTLIV